MNKFITFLFAVIVQLYRAFVLTLLWSLLIVPTYGIASLPFPISIVIVYLPSMFASLRRGENVISSERQIFEELGFRLGSATVLGVVGYISSLFL